MKEPQRSKAGDVTLYDPKSGDPFRVPRGVDWRYYVGKGFLVEAPEKPKSKAKEPKGDE